MLAIGRALMTRPTAAAPRRAVAGPRADPGRSRSSRSSRRSTARARRSCWSSRTRCRRSPSRTAATCCRPAGSCARATPRRCSRTRRSSGPTSAAERPATPVDPGAPGPGAAAGVASATGHGVRLRARPTRARLPQPIGSHHRRALLRVSSRNVSRQPGLPHRPRRSRWPARAIRPGTRFATNAGQPSPSAAIRPWASRRNLGASSSSIVASVHGLAPGTRSRWITSRTSRSLARLAGSGGSRGHRDAMVGEIGPGGRRIGQVIVVGLLARARGRASGPPARGPCSRPTGGR